MRRNVISASMMALAVGWFALIAPALPAFARAEARDAKANTDVFDEAWRTTRDKFYDRKLSGLDWEAVGNKHRADYAAAKTEAERAAAINAMLAELGASHTHYYTKDEPAYYELADIFAGALRRELPKYFPGNKISYPGIGIFTKVIDGKTFVSGVFPGQPAAKAGLLLGDEIIAVDGAPFEPVGSFRNKVGKSVALKIRRTAGGPETELRVEPQNLDPGDTFESALKDSARIIESNGRRIGYVHVWSYAGQNYQELLEDILSDGALKDADALIWDLRDGWGGARPRFLSVFDPHGPTMRMTERNGDTHLENYRWRKPVALLINNGSRSGKEVLAYGFKQNNYGQLIGERSAGALLAATAFMLSDGSLLMLAVNDVSIEGERLEGKGVAPTIEVPFDIRYAAGKDPQLEKAIEVLAGAA
jgi:carboxyl-terminal processing protease